MIGSVIGDKAVATGTLLKKQTNRGSKQGIIAGTKSLEYVLEKTRAHQVS